MSTSPIGKLERVALREVWKHEATDFTQWLPESAAPCPLRVKVFEIIDGCLLAASRLLAQLELLSPR